MLKLEMARTNSNNPSPILQPPTPHPCSDSRESVRELEMARLHLRVSLPPTPAITYAQRLSQMARMHLYLPYTPTLTYAQRLYRELEIWLACNLQTLPHTPKM